MDTAPTTIVHSMAWRHRRRFYVAGVGRFLFDFTLYLLLLIGVCLLPSFWLKALCVIVAGFVIGRLFGVAHDAAHDSLTPSRPLNRCLARLAFLPAFTPLTSWVVHHHVGHHAHLRVKGKDMIWCPLSLEEYRARSWVGKGWYRLQHFLLGVGVQWLAAFWWPGLIWAKRADMKNAWPAFRIDRVVVLVYAIALWAGLSAVTWLGRDLAWADPLDPVGVLLGAIVAPFFAWAMISGAIDLVTHTHPRVTWFADREQWSFRTIVTNTPQILFPYGLNKVFHNFFDHTAHHVDPRIPLYHLPGAQAELAERFPDDVVVERFSLSYMAWVLRHCRLYDFERHCWLDYDGTPTSTQQIVRHTDSEEPVGADQRS